MNTLTPHAVALLFTMLAGLASPLRAQPPAADEQKLAEQLADRVLPIWNEPVARKWPAAPKLSCIGEAVKYRALVQQFIADTGAILAGLPSPVLVADDTAEADIFFAVDTSAKLSTYRRQQRVSGVVEMSYSADDSGALQRFFIFVETRSLGEPGGAAAKKAVYCYLLNALGFTHGVEKGAASKCPSLETDFERKLLRFLYEFVPSGSSRADLRRLARLHWPAVRLAAPAPAPPAPQEPPDAAFVTAALTDNGRLAVRRWPKSPRYSCLGDAAAYRPFVEETCGTIREALKGLVIQPAVGKDHDKTADILVRVLKEGEPPTPNERVPYREDLAVPRFGAQLALRKWHIDLPAGRPETETQILLAKGILQSLGLWAVENSDAAASILARGTAIGAWDKQILRLTYFRIRVGSTPKTIEAAVKQGFPPL